MPTSTRERYEVADPEDAQGKQQCLYMEQTLVAPGVTDTVSLSNQATIAITGTATSFTARAERSASGAAGTFAPADDDYFTGNLATGFPVRLYDEPTKGHWRVNITALVGGNATVNISGPKG